MPLRDSAPNGAPCWVDLFSSDPDKSVEFYGRLFGWTAEPPNEEFGGYINFNKDGVRIAGCVKNDGSTGQPDATSAEIVELGGSIILPAEDTPYVAWPRPPTRRARCSSSGVDRREIGQLPADERGELESVATAR